MTATRQPTCDLSIIIVDMNNGNVLRACLDSIFHETKAISLEVIVVDNGSTDGSGDLIRQEFPLVKVVRNETNLGFAAANNRGLVYAGGAFVLLLNPDTEVLDRALEKAVAFMRSKPNAGIAGCTLHYPDGAIQHSVRSFPTLIDVFFESTFLYLLLRRSRMVGRYYMTFFDYNESRLVDWLSGAFFMIRREVVDAVGILDERFWMYTEEVDYCYRAKVAGFETWFYCDAHIIHHWGGPNVTSKRLMLWVHRSQVLFFRKHFPGFKGRLLIACKFGGLCVRVPIYAIAGLLTANARLLQKSRLYAYAVAHVLER